ncbi:hypothetical protein NSQ91_28425 [Paenibacillus sp. FSL R7-0048]|nr:hypothetical protein [Paenibacillus odorifer]
MITETGYQWEINLRNETVLTIANGYIGLSGSWTIHSVSRTYLN